MKTKVLVICAVMVSLLYLITAVMLLFGDARWGYLAGVFLIIDGVTALMWSCMWLYYDMQLNK